MVPSATALAPCLALLLACLTHGEGLPSPRSLHFSAKVGWHLLRWEPDPDCPSNTHYNVEYKVYGTNSSWTAIPECEKTSELSCDLTNYTLDLQQRYYARVRAVSGDQKSPWKRTGSFSPQEAGLRLAGQSLSVLGNSIQVRLQLLLPPGNVSQEDREHQETMTRYHVYVRRTRDNHTLTVVEKSPEFTIGELFWLTEYCLSVEPRLAHRRVPSWRSDEQCVTTGLGDRSSELLPAALSSSLMTLLLLGLLGALLACTYIRKPVRTPSVLKSLMKQSSLRGEHEPPSSGSLDADPTQQLFLCQKEPENSPEGSTSTAQPPLEQGWKVPAWPKEQLEPTGSRDSSGTSTDSGICLHIPSSSSSSSSSSSCSAGSEPQGYRQQLPLSEDSGVGLGSPCPAPGCPSGGGNASPEKPGLSPAPSQEDVEFRGYLQQSKGTVGAEQPLDKGVAPPGCAGAVQGTDTVLDMECPELAVSKGYLKQSAPERPLTQHLAPQGAPAWDFSSQVGPQAPTLLRWAAPAAPLTSKASPELKTPFDLNIFNNTAFLGTLPLISSLSSNWITPPINPLSQLSGDSKDSRL